MAGPGDPNIPGSAAPVITDPLNTGTPTDTATMWRGVTNFDQLVVAYISREIEENLRDALRWMNPGAYRSGTLIPGTNMIRYVGYTDLLLDAANDVVAKEGEPNALDNFGIGYENILAEQYMKGVGITDVSMDMAPHDLAAIASERLSYNAAETVDDLIAQQIVGQTDASVVIDKATTPVNLDAAIIREGVTWLKKRNVPTFPDGFYRAMIDPNVVYDLMSDTAIGGWIEASKYAAPDQLLNGEIGRMYGVRFIETNKRLNTAANRYTTTLFGPDYFAMGDLQTIRSYFVSPGGDHQDYAAQKAILSWKGMFGVQALGIDMSFESPAFDANTKPGPRFVNINHAGTL